MHWAASQCKLMNGGVTCVLFGSLKINLAAAFWINCRGLMELAGREHRNSPVWTEQEPEQGVVKHVSERKRLIFLILYNANLVCEGQLIIKSQLQGFWLLLKELWLMSLTGRWNCDETMGLLKPQAHVTPSSPPQVNHHHKRIKHLFKDTD